MSDKINLGTNCIINLKKLIDTRLLIQANSGGGKSWLHKDAGAEANNKLIGRTFLDIDMKRAGDELGFASKTQILQLRELESGEFFGFGSAMSAKGVIKTKIGNVMTTHPTAGARKLFVPPPATSKIRKILEKITDLPKEAEIELNTMQDFKSEIHRLKMELRKAQSQQPIQEIDEKAVERVKQQAVIKYELSLKVLQRSIDKQNAEISKTITEMMERFKKISSLTIFTIPQFQNLKIDIPTTEKSLAKVNVPSHIVNTIQKRINNIQKEKGYTPEHAKKIVFDDSTEEKITGGAMRMLKACAMFNPNKITRARMGAIAGLSYKSGTFGTYLATLKRNSLIIGNGDIFSITEKGLELVGDIESLPTDSNSLIEMWCRIIKGGASRMLKVLAEEYP